MQDKKKLTTAGDKTPPKRAPSDSGTSISGSTAPWLLTHKVQIPDLVAGYVDRPDLEQRCAPMSRRLTLLQAPGGFGKTALLGQCCHRLRDDGTTVAWLALDEEDGPAEVATYLTLAFEQAGIATVDGTGRPAGASAPELEADTQAGYRINVLIRAVERHGGPCLLALDELERLRSPEAIGVLNALLQRCPRNLRIAMAFRERPQGLDTAMFLLEGHGDTITAEELRFSKPDVARFFAARLSRRELKSVAESSAGWPIALRIYRNALQAGTPLVDVGGGNDTVAAWMESRLWRGLPTEDREFLLEVSLFDWIDAELIDEATGRPRSGRRIESMTSLAGLVQAAGGDAATLQLHPLIREYCADTLFRENPSRFRSVHAAIARGLARRGHVLDALRHSVEAGDAQLTGEIATGLGSLALWIGRGFDALQAMDGWLSADVIAAHPRLALMRCIVLALSGDMDGARRVYQTAAMESAGFTRSPGGDEEPEMKLDHLLVLGVMLVMGCSPLPRYEPLVSTLLETTRHPDINPLLRGILRHGLCLALTEMSEFDRAAEWSDRAVADLGRNTLYLSPFLGYQLGLAAMAQGRTEEAATRYADALRLARAGHLGNAGTVMFGEILVAELDLERGAHAPVHRQPPVSPRLLGECGAWLDVYAANTGIAAELALHDGGVDRALAVVDNAGEFARRTERSALSTFLAALRVSLLVIGERHEQAARAWQSDGLPASDDGCLDFKTYRWREVEAIAEARLRLLIARDEFEAARRLASRLGDAARQRRLMRTLMRTLALSMRLELLAGETERANEHLVDYLEAYAGSDFARPLAREKDLASPLLDAVIDAQAPASIIAVATELRDALARPDRPQGGPSEPVLNPGELEVLHRLEAQADKAIARDLDLTYDGVRYRVRRIFAKLGARGPVRRRAPRAGVGPVARRKRPRIVRMGDLTLDGSPAEAWPCHPTGYRRVGRLRVPSVCERPGRHCGAGSAVGRMGAGPGRGTDRRPRVGPRSRTSS